MHPHHIVGIKCDSPEGIDKENMLTMKTFTELILFLTDEFIFSMQIICNLITISMNSQLECNKKDSIWYIW